MYIMVACSIAVHKIRPKRGTYPHFIYMQGVILLSKSQVIQAYCQSAQERKVIGQDPFLADVLDM